MSCRLVLPISALPFSFLRVIYFDDIIIFSKSIDEHLTHLEEVFRRLRKTQINQTFLLNRSKLASQTAMITIRMSLLRSTMHVRHHIHKKLSTTQIKKWMTIRPLLIINRFLLLKEISRNVKEKAKCNIRSNGSAIPKINRPGNRRKIFWINVLSNILSMAKGENPVYSMFESQFSIFFILRQCCVSSAKQFQSTDKLRIYRSQQSRFLVRDIHQFVQGQRFCVV